VLPCRGRPLIGDPNRSSTAVKSLFTARDG
jgi:hypothetical protein